MYYDPYFYFRYAIFANWCKPVQKDWEENFRHAEVNKINSIQILKTIQQLLDLVLPLIKYEIPSLLTKYS